MVLKWTDASTKQQWWLLWAVQCSIQSIFNVADLIVSELTTIMAYSHSRWLIAYTSQHRWIDFRTPHVFADVIFPHAASRAPMLDLSHIERDILLSTDSTHMHRDGVHGLQEGIYSKAYMKVILKVWFIHSFICPPPKILHSSIEIGGGGRLEKLASVKWSCTKSGQTVAEVLHPLCQWATKLGGYICAQGSTINMQAGDLTRLTFIAAACPGCPLLLQALNCQLAEFWHQLAAPCSCLAALKSFTYVSLTLSSCRSSWFMTRTTCTGIHACRLLYNRLSKHDAVSRQRAALHGHKLDRGTSYIQMHANQTGAACPCPVDY